MNKTSDLVNLVLCICAKDGVITQLEEETTFKLLHAFTSKSNDLKALSESDFEKLIDKFFASDKQLEDYLNEFNDKELLSECLLIAKDSASSDGFDIKENIAYRKALSISGIKDKDLKEWENL
tara:strand:- start:160 stop:528 length:369 start_codon:yes stop_codon:yes gene_type:complete